MSSLSSPFVLEVVMIGGSRSIDVSGMQPFVNIIDDVKFDVKFVDTKIEVSMYGLVAIVYC